MKGLIILILITLLAGCLPKQEVRTAGVVDDQQNNNDGGTTTSTSDVELAWYQSLSSSTTLSLYRDSAENTYVRGRRIENFLLRRNSPTTSYCLEIDFGAGLASGDRRYLRLRAVPLAVNNVATGVKTIYLRVDFANTAAGQSVCNVNKLQYINDTTTQSVTYASVMSSVSFTLASTAASAITQIQTSNIKLYTLNTQGTSDQSDDVMEQVKPTELDLSLLVLQLQPGNAPNIGGSCTSGGCSALGYDCCLQNQCVNDGSVRPETAVNSTAFLSAEQEKLTNPLAFLKYPQYYYICGTSQPQPLPGTGNQNDADAAAAARLLEMQKDYACIQHLKQKTSANPFHLQPYNATATYDQTKCDTVTASAQYYWENVLNRLYTNCGCAAANNTLSLRLANCPKYDYQVVAQNSAGTPIQFSCTVIDENTSGGPFQNLDVAVNSRAVPHRFFDGATGTEVNPAVANSSTTQEGLTFAYADPEKTQPINGRLNMNSILGQMNVDLTQAMPAKIVDVELDKVYLIATRSGYYTPCPTCAKDSWFSSFSANPAVGQGVGLQAVGHSTSRDSWDNNTTLGNYEDTIFGRACWVPPTMLPFSQPAPGQTTATDATVQIQRQARLRTQATMWVNGYQRDWYGFNKGALIGSFDGVTWFAVGKGRIVRSTTKKLFLAINAPFGDLAESNNHVVSVQDYEGQATAALQDFHPEYVQNHPSQNEAGNCQAFHMCEKDTDCITRLGWEYACADVTALKTHWPNFYPEGAVERAAVSGDEARSIEGILAQGTLPSGSTKRCVYRGAGSLCRTDSGSISAVEMEKRKLLTCAPNFWCADVDGTNSNIPGTSTQLKVFNQQVARFARPLDELPIANNHFYGRDTNQLGRPLDYLHNKFTTPASSLVQLNASDETIVRNILNANGVLIDAAANNKIGLCRPGKRLPLPTDVGTQWNPFNQHQGLDEFSRTDYTNQIGGCPANYTTLGASKVASCPVIGADGNYQHLSAGFSSETQTSWRSKAQAQNSCGLETLSNGTVITGMTADQMQNASPFKLIEGKPLNTATTVLPSLTRDACLRKAGSVCHTDLDCAPNKYHADQTQYFNNSWFGNQPNREYYEQHLVCGQGTAKPFLSDPEFEDYDITKNVCCREIGKDITTYSAFQASSTTADLGITLNLNPLASGINEPTNANRYERFSHVQNLGTTFPVLNAFDDRDATTGAITSTSMTGVLGTGASVNVTRPDQWKTLNQANSKTCCGGGWIRKFDDGTTDWSKRDRFRVDVTNFSCLNYLSPLVDDPNPLTNFGISRSRIDTDISRYCTDISGGEGNCAQITIPEGNVSDPSCSSREYAPVTGIGTYVNNPYSILPSAPANFSTLPGEVSWTTANNIFAFFPPISADSNPATMIEMTDASSRQNVTIVMPSYVADATSATDPVNFAILMQRRNGSNAFAEQTCTEVAAGATGITDSTSVGSCGGNCCYEYNATTRVLKVGLGPGFTDPNSRYGVRVSFTPPGVARAATLGRPSAKRACSDVHYLSILGTMELAGVPQITYPKILCNNNDQRLVPGLYTAASRTAFNSASNGFHDSVNWRTSYHGLSNGAVFSPQDFKCCTPLNKTTKDGATCCSGYAVEADEDGTGGRKDYICKLPSGANLSVYLNRYISNEGMSDHLDVNPMVEADFNTQTGEPLLTATVNAKVAAIGQVVCESGQTRRGGAFGEFAPQPTSGLSSSETVYGIIDSPSDNGGNSSGGATSAVGYNAFVQGYRWNHHLYCQ